MRPFSRVMNDIRNLLDIIADLDGGGRLLFGGGGDLV
jgi:hypothetical protein